MNIFKTISIKGRKQDLFTIIFALILIVIIFIIVLVTTVAKPSSQTQITTSTTTSSTPSGTPISVSPLTPTSTPTPAANVAGANPPLTYDQTAVKRFLSSYENRQTLSSTDATAKATILALLPTGQKSGLIY